MAVAVRIDREKDWVRRGSKVLLPYLRMATISILPGGLFEGILEARLSETWACRGSQSEK